MLNSNMLHDRVALVTGAGGEIGAATVRLMVARGAKVVGVDVRPMTMKGHADLGAAFHPLAGDVTDEASVQSFVAAAEERFGPIDIFFNNAGIEGPVNPVGSFSLESFRKVVDVNLIGVFLGLKHVVPGMMQRGRGAVINMSSVAGLTGTSGICAYNATKHAVIGLTRSVAAEAGPHGVRPARRYGTPEEVAALVAFLASEDARYINGAVMTIDGGFTVG